MQVLVLYYSKGGNTKKLADEVAKGVQGVPDVSCLLKSTTEVTREDFIGSDGIIVGSPCYFGTMAAELKGVFEKFTGLRRQMGDKVGAAFATGAQSSGGKETTIFSILQALMIFGVAVVGDPMDATGHFGVASVGAPDELNVQHARKLGRRVAELAKKIKGTGTY